MTTDRGVGTQSSEGASYEGSRRRDSVPTIENGVSGRDWGSLNVLVLIQRASL